MSPSSSISRFGALEIRLCTCLVITGGALDIKQGCPMHRPEYGDVPGWAVPTGDPRTTSAEHSGGVESVATTKSARRRANDPGHGIGTEVQMQSKRTALTRGQKLRKLQLAVDHIAAVLEQSPVATAELSEALDLIHVAEHEIADDDRPRG